MQSLLLFEVMNLRKQWILLLCLGLLLLAVGGTIVVRHGIRYQRSVWADFRHGCLAQVTTLEEYAEYWILRDQTDSITAAARLLLLGNGLYVDVVLPGGTLFSEQVQDLTSDLIPPPIDLDKSGTEIRVRELPHELVEVTAPISLEGYADSVVGIIRIGFSGEYVASRIQHQWLRVAGIGSGAWLLLMIALSAGLWFIQQKQRVASETTAPIECGTLLIDLQTREVHLGGQPIDLTPKLYALLVLLARRPNEVISDDEILSAIWSDSSYAASADVTQCVYRLRQKLGAAHPNPKQMIVNVMGFGYRLVPPTDERSLSAD